MQQNVIDVKYNLDIINAQNIQFLLVYPYLDIQVTFYMS
jgi:hypothetical protein